MEIKVSPKIKDYLTTLALAAVPIIITYQAQIGAYVPVEYALIFTIAIGTLSQIAANSRVKDAVAQVSGDVDKGQSIIEEYIAKVAELQAEVDAKQAEIEKVAGLKTMTEEPVME